MRQRGHTQWQRHRRDRRAVVRRMLATGAIVGLVGGLVAQLLVAGADPELRWVVRIALLVPGVVFVGWWLVGPGIGADRDEHEAAAPDGARLDVDARIARIEAAFDSTAGAPPRPAAHHRTDVDADARRELRASIRRTSHGDVSAGDFGVAGAARARGSRGG